MKNRTVYSFDTVMFLGLVSKEGTSKEEDHHPLGGGYGDLLL